MNQLKSPLEQTKNALASLRDLQQQKVAISRQVAQAEVDLQNQAQSSLNWIKDTLERLVYPEERDVQQQCYVWQRIAIGSIYERDMLDAIAGFWLKPIENAYGILVCTSSCFVELQNISLRVGETKLFDADIKKWHNPLERIPKDQMLLEKYTKSIIQTADVLQRALTD